MHELGIVYEVIKVVDGFVKENNIKHVEKIVLEIGQLSESIPRFIEACYPAAVFETLYESTKLEIISVEAIGDCEACHGHYNIINHNKICPHCGASSYRLMSGQEFNIKEILAY